MEHSKIFGQFIAKTDRIVVEASGPDIPVRIVEQLPALLEQKNILTAENKALPATGYVRNNIFLCPDDRFSVIAMVWPPHFTSPIHNHKTWCAFGVMVGTIRNTCFSHLGTSATKTEVVPSECKDLVVKDVISLPADGADIHCMQNPTDSIAITLHVYGGNATKMGVNVRDLYKSPVTGHA